MRPAAPAATDYIYLVAEAAAPLGLLEAAAPLPEPPALDDAPAPMPVPAELPAPLVLPVPVVADASAPPVDGVVEGAGITTVSFSTVVELDAEPAGAAPLGITVVSFFSHPASASAPISAKTVPVSFISTRVLL